MFVVLAASMFGFYDLQLPSALHSKAHAASAKLRGGELGAVALMGMLSAAIVSPCVAAPLAGALLYISQTRDAVLGGAALFSLALGMGVPLVVVGTTEGALLPKSPRAMAAVKKFFGFCCSRWRSGSSRRDPRRSHARGGPRCSSSARCTSTRSTLARTRRVTRFWKRRRDRALAGAALVIGTLPAAATRCSRCRDCASCDAPLSTLPRRPFASSA
jgi:hypothetical protein